MTTPGDPFVTPTPTPTHSAVDAGSRGAYATPGSGSAQNLARNDEGLPRWQEKYDSNPSRRKRIVSFPSSPPHIW